MTRHRQAMISQSVFGFLEGVIVSPAVYPRTAQHRTDKRDKVATNLSILTMSV